MRKYVVRREVKKGDKTLYKSPKIQRLITEKRIRRKKLVKRGKLEQYKKGKEERAKYEKVLSKYIKERKAAHAHTDAKEVAPVAAAPAKAAAPVKQAAPAKQAPAPAQAPAKQAAAKQQKK